MAAPGGRHLHPGPDRGRPPRARRPRRRRHRRGPDRRRRSRPGPGRLVFAPAHDRARRAGAGAQCPAARRRPGAVGGRGRRRFPRALRRPREDLPLSDLQRRRHQPLRASLRVARDRSAGRRRDGRGGAIARRAARFRGVCRRRRRPRARPNGRSCDRGSVGRTSPPGTTSTTEDTGNTEEQTGLPPASSVSSVVEI